MSDRKVGGMTDPLHFDDSLHSAVIERPSNIITLWTRCCMLHYTNTSVLCAAMSPAHPITLTVPILDSLYCADPTKPGPYDGTRKDI